MKKETLLRSNHASQSGYTLLEIMLVIAIIMVLVGSAAYMLMNNLETAKDARVLADITSITTQLRTYEASNMNLPTTEQGLQALVSEPSAEPRPRRWKQLMERVPLDPWNQPYQYRNPGVKNPKGFDLYSFGKDGKESEDDIGNWQTDKP